MTTSSGKTQQKLRLLLLALALALSAGAYWSIVDNFFREDDFIHLYNLVSNGLLHFILTPHGGHALMVRNLVFSICYALFGLDPHGYFALALVTHVANVGLLFLIVERMTGAVDLAFLGATLWGVSPANEGALGWYSVYGHVLLVTIVLWLLYDVMRVRDGRVPPSVGRAVTWCVLLLASSTSFGIGMAVAMTFSGVVYLMLPRCPQRITITAMLASLALVVPVAYLAFYRTVPEPLPLDGLLVSTNWRGGVEMFRDLLTYGIGGLVLPCGATTDEHALDQVLALIVAACLLASAAWSSPETRRRLAALTLVVCSCYASIAIGRGWVVRGMGLAPEWGAQAPRYHYLGPAVIAIILCILLRQLAALNSYWAWSTRLLAYLWLAGVLAFDYRNCQAIDHHDAARSEVLAVLHAVDSSSQATLEGEVACLRNRAFRSAGWAHVKASFPGWAAVFAIAHPDHIANGRRVHFIESDPATLALAKASPGSADLLVSPDQLPPRCRVF